MKDNTKELKQALKEMKIQKKFIENKIQVITDKLDNLNIKMKLESNKNKSELIKFVITNISEYFSFESDDYDDLLFKIRVKTKEKDLVLLKKFISYFLFYKAYLTQREIKDILNYKTESNISVHNTKISYLINIDKEYNKYYTEISDLLKQKSLN